MTVGATCGAACFSVLVGAAGVGSGGGGIGACVSTDTPAAIVEIVSCTFVDVGTAEGVDTAGIGVAFTSFGIWNQYVNPAPMLAAKTAASIADKRWCLLRGASCSTSGAAGARKYLARAAAARIMMRPSPSLASGLGTKKDLGTIEWGLAIVSTSDDSGAAR